MTGYTDPFNHHPPVPRKRFYVELVNLDGRKTARSLQGLSDDELRWVVRSLLAEVELRREAGRRLQVSDG